MRARLLLLLGVVSCAGCGACASDGAVRDADVPDTAEIDATVAPESACSNGVDDDLDGAADCADTDCTPAVLCVPAPQVDWSAPGQLRAGETAAACAAPYDTELYLGNADLTSTPASCACACGAPTSSQCANGYVCERGTTFCAGSCGVRSVGGAGCVDAPETSVTYQPRNGLFASGTCGAGTATATVDPPIWGRQARFCGTAGASPASGCGDGQVCVPRPASPSPACVMHAGDVGCPEGYPERTVFYGGVDDSRTCTSCTCQFAATGCTIAYTAFSEPGCGGSGTPLAIDACYDGDPASFSITHDVTGASCAQSAGGTPTGSATASMPSTVCCTP